MLVGMSGKSNSSALGAHGGSLGARSPYVALKAGSWLIYSVQPELGWWRRLKVVARRIWAAGQPSAAVPTRFHYPNMFRLASAVKDLKRRQSGFPPFAKDAKDGAPSFIFGVGGRGRPPLHLVPCWHAAVLLQPLQLFPHLDLAVPGILIQAVAFAGED
jgi:hypothetical protein